MKNKGIIYAAIILLSLLCTDIRAQEALKGPVHFIEPELMIGKVVHNYPDHPETGTRNALFLSIGTKSNNIDEHWAYYYNQPSTGVSISYAGVGNREVFGNEISLIPYLQLNTSRRKESNWYFKFGLGLSYFTKFYDAQTNAENEVIGSRFTYTFQLFLYKSILLTRWIDLKAGGGYLHSSNGHTQLPNFGLNSAILSLSAQFFTKPIDLRPNKKNIEFKADRSKHYFLMTRFGYGWHEYGGTRRPVGGPKKGVYSASISGGIIFRQQIKVRTGFTYRIYQHYLDDIRENEYPEYNDNPIWNSSNLIFILGSEFLIGHIGMDIEGGINLHKPFYKDFYDKYESGSERNYVLKKTFPARLGINYYLISTNKKPKNNIFIGVHINANFGQADFAELNFGYSHLLK